MQTQMSRLYYPEKQPPSIVLRPDDCYFLVKLHHAQAFFEAGWLNKEGVLTLSSSVESSFQPGLAQSLHQVTTLRKNKPCAIQLEKHNLTDWLPFRATDFLRITLNYRVVQNTPLKKLFDQMNHVDLVAKVSIASLDWMVAVKVSQIVGKLLSYLLQEGKETEVFDFKIQLNMPEVKTGFYVVFGSQQNARWPTEFWINDQEHLDGERHLLNKLSIAVIKVLALPRRGAEIARGKPWWELLQAAKNQALIASSGDNQQRQQGWANWHNTLGHVRTFASQERRYLLTEIDQLIQQAHVEVNDKYFPTATESTLDLSDELQQLLGVRNEEELYQSVRDYQDALDVSHRLLEQYQ